MLTKKKMQMLGASLLAVVAAAAFPAAASAATCENVATSKVFAPLGDLNDYFLAPGGDFEGALTWSTAGPGDAALHPPRAARRRFHRDGAGDRRLDDVAEAVRGPAAPDAAVPRLRLPGHRHAAGRGGRRQGREPWSSAGSPAPTSRPAPPRGTWPSARCWASCRTRFKHVRLRLTAESGTWVADAVYIDPYMR